MEGDSCDIATVLEQSYSQVIQDLQLKSCLVSQAVLGVRQQDASPLQSKRTRKHNRTMDELDFNSPSCLFLGYRKKPVQHGQSTQALSTAFKPPAVEE